jgi:HD superfamily phosphohydrolase YqeK
VLVATPALPSWAQVGPKRLAHIQRVAALLDSWGAAMSLSPAEHGRWVRAGWLHDAIKDAPTAELRSLAPGYAWDDELLHGPAVAAKLLAEGESDAELVEAVRWHSVGCVEWGMTGKALYCADFLDPERKFDREGRATLAERFPHDADAVFREVVMRRVEWTERSGWPLLEPTRALWNSLR